MLARAHNTMEPARNLSTDVHDTLERATDLLRAHDAMVELAEEAAREGHPPPGAQQQAQNLDALRALLDPLHPADVAYILEALPVTQRLVVWDLVKAEIGRAHV